MARFVVISGCSGGGKSTLLAELERRGHPTVAEPGRRIVAEELRSGGRALPWVDAAAFARRAIGLALADIADVQAAGTEGWVFFDRGLVDAASALQHLTGAQVRDTIGSSRHYHRKVFLTPPWPEIYRADDERRHGLEEAIAEYDRLLETYPALGYDIQILPRTDTGKRADLVLGSLLED